MARAAGVTTNTVYWYFPSKDHLFAAVLDRWMDGALATVHERARQAPPAEVARLAARLLRELQPLLTTLHQRSAHVDVLRELHDRLTTDLRQILVAALRRTYDDEADAAAAASLLVILFEGAYAHPWEDPPDGLVEAAIQAFATA